MTSPLANSWLDIGVIVILHNFFFLFLFWKKHLFPPKSLNYLDWNLDFEYLLRVRNKRNLQYHAILSAIMDATVRSHAVLRNLEVLGNLTVLSNLTVLRNHNLAVIRSLAVLHNKLC